MSARHQFSCRRAVEIGTAAEYIVCADLMLAGHRAFLSSAALPYDVVADVGGRLLRVGVKSTMAPRLRPERECFRLCYQFAATRPRHRRDGKHDRRLYDTDLIDLLALVALDIKRIAYVAVKGPVLTSWHIDGPDVVPNPLDRLGRRTGARKKRFEDYPLSLALKNLGVEDA